MTSITSQLSLAAVVQIATDFTQAPTVASTAASLTSWTQQAQQALTTLKQPQTQGQDLVKAAAVQRLNFLKTELKNLLLYGGDPKERAERAAEIAKEIKQAVKDYAAAGGSPTDSVASAASTSGPAASATAGSSADTTTATASSSATVPATVDASQTTTTAAATTTPAGGVSANDRAISNALTAPSASDADRAFINEAADLARQAKAAIAGAIQAAKQRHETPEVTGSEGADALKAVNDAAATLGLDGDGGAAAIAAYDASAQSVPAPVSSAVAVSA